MKLDNRVAAVTGGTAGIGRAIAEAYLDEGARVAVMARDPAKGAKHAVNGLTKSVAQEVGQQGVTVNAICPGLVITDIIRDTRPATSQAMGIGRGHYWRADQRGRWHSAILMR